MGFNRRRVKRIKEKIEPRILEVEEVMQVPQVEEIIIEEVQPIIEEKKEEAQLIEVIEQINEVVKLDSVIDIEITDNTVVCINTMKFYKDNKEASEETGVSAGSIKRCCKGDTKSAGKDAEGNKLVWKYAKDL